MEDLKEKKAEHKRRFYDWLSNSNDAKNSTILTNEKYDQIKKCLWGKIAPDQDLKRRIERQKFQLVNFEGLGLHDVIWVPTEGGKVSFKENSSWYRATFLRSKAPCSISCIFRAKILHSA